MAELEKTPVLVIPKSTYTKTAYSRAYCVNRVKIDQMIKDRELKTIKVNGVTLIVA